MAKKRPNYVNDLVARTNEHLRHFKVKEQDNDLFAFIVDYLLDKDMYEGFNFFKYDKNHTIVHAGTYDIEKFDFLQIY